MSGSSTTGGAPGAGPSAPVAAAPGARRGVAGELHAHLDELVRVAEAAHALVPGVLRWAERLAGCFAGGGRLLVAGNGGSAAQAQHLTAELVGRYRHDRRALPALPLHGDTSALTAVANDYGYEHVFARQVQALAAPGDVVLLLTTSGRSPNLLAAAEAARAAGAVVLALTGPGPNPLRLAADDALAVDGATTAAVQEVQLALVHLLTEAVEAGMGLAPTAEGMPPVAGSGPSDVREPRNAPVAS